MKIFTWSTKARIEKGQPIIKAHLNPLVIWIWLGVWIMLVGTGLALVPNAPAPVRVPAARLIEHAAPAVHRRLDV